MFDFGVSSIDMVRFRNIVAYKFSSGIFLFYVLAKVFVTIHIFGVKRHRRYFGALIGKVRQTTIDVITGDAGEKREEFLKLKISSLNFIATW